MTGAERSAKYTAAHPERVATSRALYRARNPDWMYRASVWRRIHPEYGAWWNARSRVTDPTNPKWPNYGGRGIQMADEWLEDFDAFLSHIGVRPVGTSLDRVNNDGHYEPGNVRWATKLQQRHNQRRAIA